MTIGNNGKPSSSSATPLGYSPSSSNPVNYYNSAFLFPKHPCQFGVLAILLFKYEMNEISICSAPFF